MDDQSSHRQEFIEDSTLELQGVVCPLNFVKTKLKLETMQKGEILKVILSRGEPERNVPRSLRREGHEILKTEMDEDTISLWVRKV